MSSSALTNKRARTLGAFNEQAYGISFDRENEEERLMVSIPNPRSDAQKAIVRIIKFIIGARSRQMNSRRIAEDCKRDIANEFKFKNRREINTVRIQASANAALTIVITTRINTLPNNDQLELENTHTLKFRAVLEYYNNCDARIENKLYQIKMLEREIEIDKIKKEYSGEMVTKMSFQDCSNLIVETIADMDKITYNQEYDEEEDMQPILGLSSSSSSSSSNNSSSSHSSAPILSSSSSNNFNFSGMDSAVRMVEEIDE